MDRLDHIVKTALLWIIGGLIFAMMATTFAQVVARYVVGGSLSWSEEIGRYIFVWITFLGMAAAVQARAHVALDILVTMLPGRASRRLETVNSLLAAAVGLALTIGGAALIRFGLHQRTAALGLPMYAVYSVIPASGVLIVYFALRNAAKINRSREAAAQ